MRQLTRGLGLTAAAALLAACGAAQADAPTRQSAVAVAHGSHRPSAAARMVCSTEVRHALATLLAVPAPPRASATWAEPTYRCTYHLAQGPLVISVRQLADAAHAHRYFTTLRKQLGTTRALRGAEGLGLPGYTTARGDVVFLKDDMTLHVDATGLPPRVNRSHRTPGDLAYTLATDIMGCWSGE